MNTPQPHIELEREFTERVTVHKNLGQEVVVTTVDKLKLCLIDNRDCLTAQREWIAPLGIFLALATTLVAAEFNDRFLKPAVWEALYIFSTGLVFLWLCLTGFRAYATRKRGGLDEIVRRVKAAD